MVFIPEIEQKSIGEQASFQSEKLRELLAYLQQHSPFYRQQFRHHAVDVTTINSLEDLQRLPTTTKEDLQQYNWDFLCVSRDLIREYTATSGTLGSPVTIALTARDLQRLAYNEYLSFGCIGAKAGDVFQLMLTLDRQFMAGIAYYNGLHRLGASSIRTGPGLPAMQWDTIQRLGTTGLVAVPSFLRKLIGQAGEAGVVPEQSTVKKVLAIGESLRDEHLAPNALLRQIQSRWPLEIYSTYAATEMQTAFTECSAFAGGHHHPELVILELLDDSGQQVPQGSPGEVTITTLGIEAMPLLRYRTGDICRAYYEPCSCGRTTLRLGPVLGRKRQMIKFKGTTLYPPAIFEVLNSMPEIEEYVIEVSTGAEDGQDQLRLYLCSPLSPEACDALIKPVFRHKWRVVPYIDYCDATAIRQMQFPANSRKQIKFTDKRYHYVNP